MFLLAESIEVIAPIGLGNWKECLVLGILSNGNMESHIAAELMCVY